MGNVAIVAIPEKEDYVWKLSSEKIPHMTLLNLGDALSDDDIAHVMEYIDHAANMSLTRFYMSVERRGPLGPNEADVLFFDKGSCGPEMAAAIDRFRSYLLREDKIKTAYDVAPQYEDWTPHLTLGYPESPAKPDLREYSGIHGMTFDKIALWVDDYAGPEFELATHGSALAMSATDDEPLEQSGVKGMKWGVRKDDRGHGLTMFMIKNGASKDQVGAVVRGFARIAGTARVGVALTNRKYKGVDLTKSPKHRKKYEAEIHDVMDRALKSGAKNTMAATALTSVLVSVGTVTTAPAAVGVLGLKLGYNIYTVKQQVDEAKTVRDTGPLKHALEGVIIPIIFEYDGYGLIKDLRLDGIPEEGVTEIEHANLDDYLAHVGVKGMKWGVRRSREQRKAAKAEEVQRHQDSLRTRELMKKKVSSLSNEELAFVNQRRQLETNYAKLNPPKAGRRKKKIENHLATLGLIEKTFTATQQPVAQLALKKALKSANTPRAQKILKALIKP